VSEAPGFRSVGEAASAEEALEVAVGLRPEFALVAAGMPGIDGFETSRRLCDAVPGMVAVVLYDAIEPSPEVVAGSGAVAAVNVHALTADALQTLWSVHGTR
jgi:two-component system invasion response regulator UvrY